MSSIVVFSACRRLFFFLSPDGDNSARIPHDPMVPCGLNPETVPCLILLFATVVFCARHHQQTVSAHCSNNSSLHACMQCKRFALQKATTQPCWTWKQKWNGRADASVNAPVAVSLKNDMSAQICQMLPHQWSAKSTATRLELKSMTHG